MSTSGKAPEARRALNELCEQYYEPVLGFLPFRLGNKDNAYEAAQGFFTKILETSSFSGADPKRGRFRSYLLGALKHYLWDEWDHSQRHNRPTISLENEGVAEPFVDPDPEYDLVFDRHWALTLLNWAMEQLTSEFGQHDKSAYFGTLKPWLTLNSEGHKKTKVCESLGLTEGAFRVAVHRLRQRFRDLLRKEITRTVDRPEDAKEEWLYLVKILSMQS
ncbi:MAG: sigma-70 family RNA polymerase sigma factor [Gemmataceae bacterium]|nr:sigma-70 family RNA polymerase sigma factor [Gemmataceae bacterium]